MGLKQKQWARRRRALLIEVLGGICAHFSVKCKGVLTIDCIVPQGDAHHRMESSARQSFYHDQLRKHNLQLLCVYHQTLKSRREARAAAKREQQIEQPF